jgi:uncharacterized protein (TIGR00369 family)
MSESSADQTSPMLHEALGLEVRTPERGVAYGRFRVSRVHMAPNRYLHAAAVIALADTCCGFGCTASLPEGAVNFTTIELKSNFLGTAKVGDEVSGTARLVHGGRSTQVWDAEVRNDTSGKTMALFRCTQMILYPPAARR